MTRISLASGFMEHSSEKGGKTFVDLLARWPCGEEVGGTVARIVSRIM
jgi:hypothetical protein